MICPITCPHVFVIYLQVNMSNELNVFWNDQGVLAVGCENIQLEYPQGKANQLILCARMNPWERFMAMLEKNTDAGQWTALNAYLTTLDKQAAWKIKEKFARLSTHEE